MHMYFIRFMTLTFELNKVPLYCSMLSCCIVLTKPVSHLHHQGLVDVAEHRDVLLAGAAVEVATNIEEPGSPIKHKRWDQVSPCEIKSYTEYYVHGKLQGTCTCRWA